MNAKFTEEGFFHRFVAFFLLIYVRVYCKRVVKELNSLTIESLKQFVRFAVALTPWAATYWNIKTNLVTPSSAHPVKCKDERLVWVEDPLSLRRSTMMATKKIKKREKKKINTSKSFNDIPVFFTCSFLSAS